MDHPVEGVQGCRDGELPGPLPPGPRAPSEAGRVGGLASGGGHQGQAFCASRVVAFVLLQQVSRGEVWLRRQKVW